MKENGVCRSFKLVLLKLLSLFNIFTRLPIFRTLRVPSHVYQKIIYSLLKKLKKIENCSSKKIGIIVSLLKEVRIRGKSLTQCAWLTSDF